MKHILELADATARQRFNNPDWVDSWQAPLYRVLHRSIGRRSPDVAASLTQIIDTFVAALDQDRADGKTELILLADLEIR